MQNYACIDSSNGCFGNNGPGYTIHDIDAPDFNQRYDGFNCDPYSEAGYFNKKIKNIPLTELVLPQY